MMGNSKQSDDMELEQQDDEPEVSHNYYENHLPLLPSVELRIVKTIADSRQLEIFIRGCSYTKKEAAQLFNHALISIPDVMKKCEEKEKK